MAVQRLPLHPFHVLYVRVRPLAAPLDTAKPVSPLLQTRTIGGL